jgi:catechol 2,3-dioxygenase-like lactoylglutathione lyase family enzyme
MPKLNGLLETSLYVDDMERSVRFFTEVMGMEIMFDDERLTAFNDGANGALLVFARGKSVEDAPTAHGDIPGHDGEGRLHMAFKIPAESYYEWRSHLREAGVKELSEVTWPEGGRSYYFEDPDGHVLELATPGLWPNYAR